MFDGGLGGLREQGRLEGPHSFMAWLEFGHSTLMIGRSGLENHNLYSPRETDKPTAEVNVIVNDIDGHFHRARAASDEIDVDYQRAAVYDARIVSELEGTLWGHRRYEGVDPEGNRWHVRQELT